jgi:hypothetical protein
MQYDIYWQSGNDLKRRVAMAHDKSAEIRFTRLSTPYSLFPTPQSPDLSIFK